MKTQKKSFEKDEILLFLMNKKNVYEVISSTGLIEGDVRKRDLKLERIDPKIYRKCSSVFEISFDEKNPKFFCKKRILECDMEEFENSSFLRVKKFTCSFRKNATPPCTFRFSTEEKFLCLNDELSERYNPMCNSCNVLEKNLGDFLRLWYERYEENISETMDLEIEKPVLFGEKALKEIVDFIDVLVTYRYEMGELSIKKYKAKEPFDSKFEARFALVIEPEIESLVEVFKRLKTLREYLGGNTGSPSIVLVTKNNSFKSYFESQKIHVFEVEEF
ncbi:MAG: hypothetical protein ACE5K0_05915 [Candidatus Methanofastidiosia archaeon]